MDCLPAEQISEFQEAFCLFDKDGDGLFFFFFSSYPHFQMHLILVLQETDAEEELREAFKVFDKDQNGFISAGEVSVGY
ncbi:hypothetical protein BHE74_00031812 [Ensete ventricosum]|uniref:Uncharacterized protein n=1 Tax=Ensete ventricosum TaxID=4639 RepID=A0A444D6K9_ENSVE|nr:hypothetical protein B296_00027995 [Ensete ventricosum]RWV93793.1 hypothetical protein GW17_00043727 [Ensete ventricosum]RWW61146.1 hypothetical protein BHE74_00031812 [Ensete ventricosum]